MLRIFPSDAKAPSLWHEGAAPVDDPLWLDLLEPTEDERLHAKELLGTSLPTRSQSSALEISNRLRRSEETLRLNIPSFVRGAGEKGPLTPLGFVLTPRLLASVRYAESIAFNRVAERIGNIEEPRTPADVLVNLIEAIVNISADRIEALGTDLSKLSEAVFVEGRTHRRQLRGALFQVGSMQRKMNQIRSAMLGVSRVVTYVRDAAPPWIEADSRTHLGALQADIASLTEFDQQLSDRLQFLLDAVLGFINNDQNDIMRVLTVVSVATMPPMILAGIWGMNFKSIPEYDWPHGYAFALTMIALSIALPLLWFKLKKWI